MRACVCERVCACACARACAGVCGRAPACVSACGLGDNTNLLVRTVGTVVGTAVKTVGTVGTVYIKSSL